MPPPERAMRPSVLISEVGPRDGLQSVARTMPTAAKFAWLDALHAAGVREIEVASFVPARHLPQMADAAEVVQHAARRPGWTVMALVPNLKGAAAALDAGVHKLTIPVSASAAHSMANVRRTPAQMVDEVRAIVTLRNERAPQVAVEVGVSTAFGCTLQGEVPDDDVVRLAAQLVAAGVDEVGLSDTTGMANPAQVKRLFQRVRAAIGDRTGAAHMHNTRGLGTCQLPGGLRRRRAHVRCVAGRPRRLSVCTGRLGQRGHRGPGLHVRGDGDCHGHRARESSSPRARRCRRACRASRSTA